MELKDERTFSLNTNKTFLLEKLSISSVQGIVFAMVFSLSIAIIFHTLNFVVHFRERHPPKLRSNLHHCLTTIVHIVSAVLAYIMVCCVKTMNVWLFVSIGLGSGIGQLVIGPFIASKLDKKFELDEAIDDKPKYSQNTNVEKSKGPTNKSLQYREVQSERKASKDNPIPINFDSFIINKPESDRPDAKKAATSDAVDEDAKSEYDCLLDHYTGDLKMFQSEETKL